MHRRQLLIAAAGAIVAPKVATAQTPSASPVSIPAAKGRPVTISPDGTMIAGTDADRKTLRITNIMSGSVVESDEVPLAITLSSIRWAPDSSAVTFSLDAAIFLQDSDIYLVDAATGALTDLTDDDPDKTGADKVSISSTPPAGAVPIDLFPAWSPDGSRLVFARTMWAEMPGGTTLMTISREGGEPESLIELQREYPMSVYSPMWWLDDDAILLSQWMNDPKDTDNGIWRVEPDGTSHQVVSGDPDSGIPGVVIADVAPDGTRASAYSQIILNQFSANAPGKIWFDVDLSAGTFQPWENRLGLPTDASDALATDGGGMLVAPPVFGPDDDQAVAFMTRTGDGPITVSVMETGSTPRTVATFEPGQADTVGIGVGYRLEWSASGKLMALAPGGVTEILQP